MADPSAYERAVKLLARRSHLRRELASKLDSRGHDRAEVEEALERLADQGYLDDERTARELASSRWRRGPMGRAKLAADLERRGADAELARTVAAEVVPDDDREAAREAARRWIDRRHGDPDKAALARHLQRRGFSTAAILDLVEEMGEEAAADGDA